MSITDPLVSENDNPEKTTKKRNWYEKVIDRTGWRLFMVVAVAIVLLAITVGWYILFPPADWNGHRDSIFTSWVGGVLLFLVAGSVVAVVSMFPPEKEAFENRARILFRGKRGPHMDYIISRLRSAIEHYAESSDRVMHIKRYDEATQKFFVQVNNTTVIHSFIDDVDTEFSTRISVRDCTPPPPNEGSARLAHVRIFDGPDARTEISQVHFNENLHREFKVPVPTGRSTKVESCTEYWVDSATEECSMTAARYTRRMSLTIENDVNFVIRVELQLSDGNSTSVEIRPGEKRKVADLSEILPNVKAFSAKFLPVLN